MKTTPGETAEGTSTVILCGGPLDGATANIDWEKGPGKTPPPRILIAPAGNLYTNPDVEIGTRVAVYGIIDNWPLRYLFEGFSLTTEIIIAHT